MKPPPSNSVTIKATDANDVSYEKTFDVQVVDAPEVTDPGVTARGTITIDANTVLAGDNGGVNWDTYLAAAYAKVTGSLPSGVQFGPDTASAYVYTLSDGSKVTLTGADLAYWWSDVASTANTGEDVHVVGGTVNGLSFGSAAETELSITGLDLFNDSGLMNRLFGETNILAQAFMHGVNATTPADLAHVKAILSSYAQNFVGSSGNDTYTGTIFDDTITGNGGDDVLAGGAGNDTITGGAGSDTAIYGGLRSEYTIAKNANGTLTVSDNRTGAVTDGVDMLKDVEKLQFSDTTIDAPANAAPTGLKLASHIVPSVTNISVAENSAEGTTVGNLSATDPEGGALTYSLTDDANGLFVIDGNVLKLAKPLGDYETDSQKSYDVTVAVTDLAGNVATRTFTIQHADAYDAPEGTLTIDASGTAGGVDFATFITDYFTGLSGGAFTFYGGTPDIAYGQPQNVSGEQIAFNYKEGGVATPDRVVLEGTDLAYDSIHSGSAFGHGISGSLDSLTFGQWVDGVTTGTAGIGDAGHLKNLSEQLKISGFDLQAAVGSGHVPQLNLLYALYSAAQTGNAANIYSALTHYAQNFKGSAGADTYTGSAFDDTVTGNGGNDVLDGGAGNDTLVLSGARSDYSWVKNQDGTHTVTDGRSADTVSNFETVQFSDGSVSFAAASNTAPTAPSLSGGTSASVAENALIGKVVGTLSATDADGDAITYTLTDDAGGQFKLVTASGVTSLVVYGNLDYETRASYNVTVKATDTNGGATSSTFTINVSDIDEGKGMITLDASAATSGMNLDTFLTDKDAGFLSGASGSGFPVFDNGPSFKGEEMFIGYGSGASSKYVLAHGELEYYFNSHTVYGEINTIEYGTRGTGSYDANGYFSGGNVELRITGLDFANAKPANATEEAEIEANGAVHNFASAYMAGSTAAQARLDLYAQQLDDYAQHFVGSAYNDTYVGTQFADTIEGKGGNDTIDGGAGTDIVVFDGVFGQGGTYSFTGGTGGNPLVVTDSRGASGTGTDTLTNVEILKFSNLTYDFVNHKAYYAPTDLALDDAGVAGNAAVGTVVGSLVVTDRDAVDKHVYTLLDDAGGRFVLDGSAIKVADTLREESYKIRVKVTDGVGQSFEKELIIDVVNPVSNSAPANLSLSASNVAENSANGTVIGVLSAVDADSDALTYTLTNNAGGKFALVTEGGVTKVVVNGALDYETAASHSVTVKVSDGNGGETSKSFTIGVTNVNEAPMITSNGGGSSAAVSVAENKTAVTTVKAADPDAGSTLTYSISGGADASKFQIDASTGALSFKSAPDYETPADTGKNNVYDVIVKAQDAGGLADTQAIAVTVTNVNEAPVITSNGGGTTASISVAENKTAVTTANASDPEKGAVTWSISGTDASLFTINASTGALAFKSAPDFEAPKDAGKNNVYDLTLTAKDAGGLTDTQALKVTVTNVNEAPVISSPAVVKVAENKTAVTTVNASDPEKKAITYSISGGADKALFKIDAKTGALSFKSAPNFEAPKDAGKDNVYNVTVKASDADKGASTQALKVTVTNVNEAPVISSNGGGSSASIRVAENKTAVTTVKAADPEKTAVTYSISGGADKALFKIDAKTGALSFKAAPDFETPKDAGKNNVYDVTVKASDGKLTDTQAIKVTVTDVKGKAVNGTAAADKLAGTVEANTLDGKAGADTLTGGKGNDTYIVDNSGDKVIEKAGEGTDLVKASVSHTLAANVENLTLTGSKAINGTGNSLANTITGNSAANTLKGGSGNDVLKGGAGNDTLYGGSGADDLYGGSGKDTFVFKALTDTTVAASGRDTIFDFDGKGGDRIDLRGIDANVKTALDDAFTFVAAKAFSKVAGELRYEQKSGETFVYGDVDGDGKADFAIHFDDALTLTKDHFLL